MSFLNSPYVIAEIGSNWLSLDTCCAQIVRAAKCGCNAAKFQLFTFEELYGHETPHNPLRNYELPREWIPLLKKCCDENNIDFMCSSFSVNGYQFIDKFVDVHKVANSENEHVDIISFLENNNKPFLISGSKNNNKYHKNEYRLDCVSSYPACFEEYKINLHTVGISDHTLTPYLAVFGIGLGKTVFEKHFDGLKLNSPDSCVSINTFQMEEYVDRIKIAFKSLTKIHDNPTSDYSRCLIITEDIKQGDKLEYNKNYGIYRRNGVILVGDTPNNFYVYHEQKVLKDKKAGDVLNIDDIADAY